jgi:CRISPR/Cas system-associated protein Cas5 (RAMP superfamily)
MPEPDGEPDMELHHYRQKKEESDVLEKKEPEPNPDGTYQDKLEKVEDNEKNAEKGDAKGRSQRAVEARQAREEAREEARELSIKEALALLENKPYTRVKTPWLQRVVRWNKWLASEKSIFAGKCAAAASVFAALSE